MGGVPAISCADERAESCAAEEMMIKIGEYTEPDTDEIIALVLHCQNDGTRPLVSADDQPELFYIREEYVAG